MGTKIEYTINLLAASPNSSSFTVRCVDYWDSLRNSRLIKGNCSRTGPDNFEDSMDKKLEKQHSIEPIKRTMQMHEDVFKHQVSELHRLYRVQKMLMEELKKEPEQNRHRSSTTNSDIDHSHFINPCHPTTQTTCGLNFSLQRLRDDPSSRERSGSCSGETVRMPRGFDLERPAEEDISTGISAIDEDQAGPSSQRPNRIDKMSIDGSEDCEVELTLSIGGILSTKTSKSTQPEIGFRQSSHKKVRHLDSSASFKSDRAEDCSDPTTPMSSSSATFDQERERPHWLFQGLKLK
ncbi:hypothetical protein F2P56_025838 [Juglans regia]|uniref:Uncharacterized protein LOC108979688 isoform X1 n=3 Tax=Juglans regia TaxID=51240 RepID=A0A2I4DFP3_JUGRE|nr:uncharacterized protein LOC108979688 isoform X1 [Juglans regia]KAF5456344.1 hypothetical protein F2P56_025838 [Juglans regia]